YFRVKNISRFFVLQISASREVPVEGFEFCCRFWELWSSIRGLKSIL
ncbi:hypothetical protein CMV_010262, partial [Castanea mollissima]